MCTRKFELRTQSVVTRGSIDIHIITIHVHRQTDRQARDPLVNCSVLWSNSAVCAELRWNLYVPCRNATRYVRSKASCVPSPLGASRPWSCTFWSSDIQLLSHTVWFVGDRCPLCKLVNMRWFMGKRILLWQQTVLVCELKKCFCN
jgi:hypothetical protein